MNHSEERRERRMKELLELLDSLPDLTDEQKDLLTRSYSDKAETDPNPSLERDLRNTPWICEKAKASKSYAQNIYAALSNCEWQKIDVMPILKDESWGCTWRYAGGIVADILEEGDYLDWYCSGIGSSGNGNGHNNDPRLQYVSEGVVTDEIREDFRKLGWRPFNEDQPE